MNEYDTIARAITYLRLHAAQQPSLAEVAAAVNLSEFHFHRLFSRWAGVTPKRYLQALTLARAKTCLRQDRLSVLETSFEAGLSSTSRLYDHFVQLEAVTPAEYRRAGEGLSIGYGRCPTPFGEAFVAFTGRGICQLEFVDDNSDVPLSRLRRVWPGAVIRENSLQAGLVTERLFSVSSRADAPLSLWVRGTNFQVNVWRALLHIPAGRVASYGDVARALGQPSAARAVARAVAANPVALLIPCHRVIRQDGAIGGYAWGEARKKALLMGERAALDAAATEGD